MCHWLCQVPGVIRFGKALAQPVAHGPRNYFDKLLMPVSLTTIRLKPDARLVERGGGSRLDNLMDDIAFDIGQAEITTGEAVS